MCDNKEQCVVTKNTLLPRVILTTSLRLLSLFSPSSSQLRFWLHVSVTHFHLLPSCSSCLLCEVLSHGCFFSTTGNLLEAFGFIALAVCHYFPSPCTNISLRGSSNLENPKMKDILWAVSWSKVWEKCACVCVCVCVYVSVYNII